MLPLSPWQGIHSQIMIRHMRSQREKNFDYVIRQQLLPGNYSSFELKDVLDSCLKYRSASVMTALGNDVTRFFNIENRSNTIVFRADSNFLKTDEAYNNVTYYFRIKVQAGSNQEIDSHNHYQRSNEFLCD